MERDGRVPFHVQISESLRQGITQGDYGGYGEKMPPIADLARDLGTSVLTIRQALYVLKRDGLIDIRRGRGTVIKYYEPATVSDEQVERNFSDWKDRVGVSENFPRLRPLADEELDTKRKLVLRPSTHRKFIDTLETDVVYRGQSRVVRVVSGQGATTLARVVHKELEAMEREVVFLDWSNENDYVERVRNTIEATQGRNPAIVIFDFSGRSIRTLRDATVIDDILNKLVALQYQDRSVRDPRNFNAVLLIDKSIDWESAFSKDTPSWPYYRGPGEAPENYPSYEQIEVYAMILRQYPLARRGYVSGNIAPIVHSDLLDEVRKDLEREGREFGQTRLDEISKLFREKLLDCFRVPGRDAPYHLYAKLARTRVA